MKKKLRMGHTQKAFAEAKSCVTTDLRGAKNDGGEVLSFLPEVMRSEYSIRISETNINRLKKVLPLASAVAKKLEPGCVCKPIVLGNGKTGALTVWPEGRAAISYFNGPILPLRSILSARPLFSARTYWCNMYLAHDGQPLFVADTKTNCRLAKAFDKYGRSLPGPVAFPEKDSPLSFFSWKAKDKTFGVTLTTGKASVTLSGVVFEGQWDMEKHHVVLEGISSEMRLAPNGSIVDDDGKTLVPASRASRVLGHMKGLSPAAEPTSAVVCPILAS